ncbi:MAG: hypothetical protein JXA58_05295, partial [Dehalococcoidia bacterium]|nr:hypothetical protein [Dehalococcoidia bacterium]
MLPSTRALTLLQALCHREVSRIDGEQPRYLSPWALSTTDAFLQEERGHLARARHSWLAVAVVAIAAFILIRLGLHVSG